MSWNALFLGIFINKNIEISFKSANSRQFSFSKTQGFLLKTQAFLPKTQGFSSKTQWTGTLEHSHVPKWCSKKKPVLVAQGGRI